MRKIAYICAYCENTDTTKWTFNRGGNESILDLCKEHEASLMDMFQLGLDPKEIRPDVSGITSHRVRAKAFEPLVGWEPPRPVTDDTDTSTDPH